MNFTEKLELLMKSKGIKNLNILSEQSGIPYMTLKNFYIKGTDNIKFSTLNKLKSFFRVTLDYLMDNTDESIELNDIVAKTANESEKDLLRKDEIELLELYNELEAELRAELRGEIKGRLKEINRTKGEMSLGKAN